MTKDPKKIERADILRYCGIGKSGFEASTHGKDRWWEYNIVEPFIKMNPSDIAAGIGLAQIGKLDDLQAYRKKIWDIYQEAFRPVDWIETPLDADEAQETSIRILLTLFVFLSVTRWLRSCLTKESIRRSAIIRCI